MCYFRAEDHASRDAIAGETLTACLIGAYYTVGFVSPDDHGIAVCVQLGARLKVSGHVPESLVDSYKLSTGDGASFAQHATATEGSLGHRLGLAFDHAAPGVDAVLLQDLLGLTVTVESVSADASVTERASELESA